MKYFQENAFGWYILVCKSKTNAEQIEAILDKHLLPKLQCKTKVTEGSSS